MTVLNLNNLTAEENARFNDIALEIRREFNGIVETVSEPHLHNINWIVGSIASRNKYTSPLFIRLCSIAFIEKELARFDKIDSIVVADRPLAQVLRNHFLSQRRFVTIHCTESISARCWRIFRPVRQYLIAVVLLSLRFLGRAKGASGRLPVDAPITLIDTFILNNKSGDEGSIHNGVYRDRYYPGLLENLTEDEKQHIFFLPTIVGFRNPIRIFRLIREARTPFLVHDDFLKLSDYLIVLLHPFRLLKCRIPQISFRNVNVTPLLRQENVRNCSDFISLLGILYYRFAHRLSEQGVQVRLLIEWYENQVIDRGMIVGFHRFHPETKIVGYQGYVIAKSLHLYTCPNSTEWLGQAVPDVVSVVGEGLKENLFEFCKDIRVNVAPGFRFQKLWRERLFYPDQNVYTILVGLPIDLGDSAHILRLLASGLPFLKNRHLRFWIKPHPTWEPDRIRRLLPEGWPDEFHFRIGDFHDSVESSNLLISNASSVSLEALAKGVPVIVVGARAGIDQNPIPETISREIWTLVHSTDECVEAIKKFQGMNKSHALDIGKIGRDLREKFFEPVTRQNVSRFLEL